jgi:hypothetical protein
MEQVFARECVRGEQKCTRLTAGSVSGLDAYAKMRVSLAKVAMDSRVAAEMLEWSMLATTPSKSPEQEDQWLRFHSRCETLQQKHPNIRPVQTVLSFNEL